LPFLKFGKVQPVLGPEMRSTGESMGIDADPALAYYRAALGAGSRLPLEGRVRLIGDGLEELAGRLRELGFSVATGELPAGAARDYDLLVDVAHPAELRRALEDGVAYVTTREAARWTVDALAAAARARAKGPLGVTALQDLTQRPVGVVG